MLSWEDYLEKHQDRFLAELLSFLRFPSISALTVHRPDCEAAAQWLAGRLEEAGLEAVHTLPTGAQPVVYGEWRHAPGKPTVLIYGHYDTQPVDPLSLWDHPPFAPFVENGRVVARGATDDKGNLLIPVAAVEALLKTQGRLPLNVKFLFEGQEEIGSPLLAAFIQANKELLACDLVLSADGGNWDEEHPALILGTRGLAAVSVQVRGPSHDLHSGSYGGTIANPLHAMVSILSTLHDATGRVAVDGFYDKVQVLGDAARSQIAELPFDEDLYLQQTGSPALFGEPGFSTLERAGIRPTLEINGLGGGFQGEGIKTVLPGEARAILSCRLVADQDPAEVVDLLLRHIRKVSPPGVTVKAEKIAAAAEPYHLPPDHPGLKIAASVLRDLFGRTPCPVYAGGTIPANTMFLKWLQAYTIVFAFGLPDELPHAPNEFFRLASFARGQRAYGMLLERLGEGTWQPGP